MKSTIVRRVASYIRKPPTIVRKSTRGNMLRMGEARHSVKDAVHRASLINAMEMHSDCNMYRSFNVVEKLIRLS
jgi:hypothetical protein